MAIFNNAFVALGVGAPAGVLTELTGGSYARLALALVGDFQAGATQALAAFGAATGPVASTLTAATPTQIRAGAIFNSASGGNQLCHWGWGPPASQTLITTAFPAVTLNLTLIGTLAASYNIFSGIMTPGELLGTMNGNPMITSTNLSIVGGVLQVAVGFTASVLSIVPAVVSAAGTTQGTATPLTSQSVIVTVSGSGAGVVATLPYHKVFNRGANALLLYPASGAQFEALGANAPVSVAVGGTVEMYMTSATQGYVG